MLGRYYPDRPANLEICVTDSDSSFCISLFLPYVLYTYSYIIYTNSIYLYFFLSFFLPWPAPGRFFPRSQSKSRCRRSSPSSALSLPRPFVAQSLSSVLSLSSTPCRRPNQLRHLHRRSPLLLPLLPSTPPALAAAPVCRSLRRSLLFRFATPPALAAPIYPSAARRCSSPPLNLMLTAASLRHPTQTLLLPLSKSKFSWQAIFFGWLVSTESVYCNWFFMLRYSIKFRSMFFLLPNPKLHYRIHVFTQHNLSL